MTQGQREHKTPKALSKSVSALTLRDIMRVREIENGNAAPRQMQSAACGDAEKQSEEEPKLSGTATSQTRPRNRPQSALPGKMQHDVMQEQTSDVSRRSSARPASAPACSRNSTTVMDRRSQGMPAQKQSNQITLAIAEKAVDALEARLLPRSTKAIQIEASRVLPRPAIQARKALEELRANLGLDSKESPV